MENYQGGTKRHPSLVLYIFRIRNWQKCKDNLKEVVDFEATAEERDQPDKTKRLKNVKASEIVLLPS